MSGSSAPVAIFIDRTPGLGIAAILHSFLYLYISALILKAPGPGYSRLHIALVFSLLYL
jgi:hypothetical protein